MSLTRFTGHRKTAKSCPIEFSKRDFFAGVNWPTVYATAWQLAYHRRSASITTRANVWMSVVLRVRAAGKMLMGSASLLLSLTSRLASSPALVQRRDQVESWLLKAMSKVLIPVNAELMSRRRLRVRSASTAHGSDAKL